MNTPTPWRASWSDRHPDATDPATQSWPVYASVAVSAGLLSTSTFTLLHLLMADKVSIFTDPVSTYALTRLGALLFGLGSLGMAVGCVAVLFGPLGRESTPRWTLGGAAVSLLFVVGFETDAGATVSSVGGYVHRYAAGIVFILISVAALYTWRRHRRQAYGRAMGVLMASNLALMVVNWSATYLPELANGGQWRGVPQRVLLAVQVVLIVFMAFAPRLSARRSRTSADPVAARMSGRSPRR